MPLTVLQKQVLRILAANRSEESHFAGGLVLNAGEESPRYSHDFDIFHEAEAEVARASDLDVLSLRSAGYEVHQTGGDCFVSCGGVMQVRLGREVQGSQRAR